MWSLWQRKRNEALRARRPCYEDEGDGYADRGGGSCSRRKPARHTDLARGAKAAGIARVGWLEVCGPGPRRPHFDIFRARLAEQGYVEGKNLLAQIPELHTWDDG